MIEHNESLLRSLPPSLPGDVNVVLVDVLVLSKNGARGHVVELDVVGVAAVREGGREGGREGEEWEGTPGPCLCLPDEEVGVVAITVDRCETRELFGVSVYVCVV